MCRSEGRFEPWSECADDWAKLAAVDPAARARLNWKARSHDHGGGWCCRIRFVDGLPPVECAVPNRSWTTHPATPPACNPNSYGCAGDDHKSYCPAGEWQEAEREFHESAAKVRDRLQVQSLDEVSQLIADEVRADYARYLRRVERWDEIVKLPQLFLGVR